MIAGQTKWGMWFWSERELQLMIKAEDSLCWWHRKLELDFANHTAAAFSDPVSA